MPGAFDRICALLTEEENPVGATECPWYKGGFCKLDGRPCPYTDNTYEECPKFEVAKNQPDVAAAIADRFGMGEGHRYKGKVRD